ncbi:hypothetical protein LZ30DRAFT_686282 [Colletotrichum cereale]|nr:hypothetical protein LZ30DRAFT_686282 [Colletotrichum cereale]
MDVKRVAVPIDKADKSGSYCHYPAIANPAVASFARESGVAIPKQTNLQLAGATTIKGLKAATPKVIYSGSNPTRCCSVRVPKIHYFDGRWYLCHTAGNDGNLDGQRMHVLRGVSRHSTCVRKLGDEYILASPSIAIISRPDQPWEQSEVPVQEGQYGLYFGGKTYIAYSAN